MTGVQTCALPIYAEYTADERREIEEIAQELLKYSTLFYTCHCIAQAIRRMMAEDKSLRYRDFVILTRSKATAFSAMMPVMLAHGIPAYADGQAVDCTVHGVTESKMTE